MPLAVSAAVVTLLQLIHPLAGDALAVPACLLRHLSPESATDHY